jgi:hypothetical protein
MPSDSRSRLNHQIGVLSDCLHQMITELLGRDCAGEHSLDSPADVESLLQDSESTTALDAQCSKLNAGVGGG